ncbi:hypothetical protein ACIN8IBEIGE_210065 [Acinetobacter sp. 8I-beige]|nr:hypothetical protein ACIN8IBEIGE_210065 [Acinetobacter sp. 8I-beige]
MIFSAQTYYLLLFISKFSALKQYKNTTIQAWHLTKKSIMSGFYLVSTFSF